MFEPRDLTIVSAVRVGGGDTCGAALRSELLQLHLASIERINRIFGIKHVLVDWGSDPPVRGSWIPCILDRVEVEAWGESRAKNRGLESVGTPLVAFTSADVVFTENTVLMTMKAIREANPFILQGFRWEVPRDVTRSMLDGDLSLDRDDHREMIESLSVPHGFPRNPTGEWQVTLTEVAKTIGGFDERMEGYGGMDTDFHDRGGCLVEMDGGAALATRKIPILHLHHFAHRPLSPNHELRHMNMETFIRAGTRESLNWRNQIPKGVQK